MNEREIKYVTELQDRVNELEVRNLQLVTELSIEKTKRRDAEQVIASTSRTHTLVNRYISMHGEPL